LCLHARNHQMPKTTKKNNDNGRGSGKGDGGAILRKTTRKISKKLGYLPLEKENSHILIALLAMKIEGWVARTTYESKKKERNVSEKGPNRGI
jgi:hypothetical protein